jgi:hypothetical protein
VNHQTVFDIYYITFINVKFPSSVISVYPISYLLTLYSFIHPFIHLFLTSGSRRRVNEMFALPGCYATKIGS